MMQHDLQNATGSRMYLWTLQTIVQKDYFMLFFTNEMFQFVADETNRYAAQVLQEKPKARSRFHQWQETASEEVQVYEALQVAMELYAKSSVEDYWRKEPGV